ncbi:MAG TPA: acyl-CoA dehydrogenase family protein [Bradyrhizobium sp.]|nr:acyl-CoA dehydrogenase family protein [Bradyrhizobium sp.]
MSQASIHLVTPVSERPERSNWLSIAAEVARRLRDTAVAREQASAPPRTELSWLREAGLLTLLNPTEAGGGGGSFTDAFRVVRELARADTSIAQILSYHFLLSHSAFWRSTSEQRDRLVRRSVAERWFWGGASNPRDALTVLTAERGGFRLNGRKTFASNASLADRITLRAAYGDAIVLIALPGDSEGIVHGNDWDAFGQRLTESGSIEFRNVRIEREDILGTFPPRPDEPLPALINLVVPIHQLLFVNFYLGTAEGALAEAANYVRTQGRPWQTSGVDHASQDPYILEHFGLLQSDLRASLALAEQAAGEIEAALQRGASLTSDERTAAAATVYAAKVNSTRVALDITSRVFDLMGARSTSARYGFDRFWRNVRTHTLHDPVAYKAREVGNYAINGQITGDPLYT